MLTSARSAFFDAGQAGHLRSDPSVYKDNNLVWNVKRWQNLPWSDATWKCRVNYFATLCKESVKESPASKLGHQPEFFYRSIIIEISGINANRWRENLMPSSLKRLGAATVASFFLFANSGDFAQAKRSRHHAPAPPDPAQADPAQPARAQTAPSQPTPAQPTPAQPGPTQAGPPQPAPAQTTSAQPVSVEPAQIHAAPTPWSGAAPDASSTCYPLMGLCFSNKVDPVLIGTILLSVGTILYNLSRERKKEREILHREREKERDIRKRYLLALKEEIQLNIGGLTKTINSWPGRPQICAFLRANQNNLVLITFSYSSVIFRNRTEVLQDLPDMLINTIVDFYGRLDALTEDVASLDRKAFETISPDGREGAVLDILEQQKLARQQGESLLTAISLRLRSS